MAIYIFKKLIIPDKKSIRNFLTFIKNRGGTQLLVFLQDLKLRLNFTHSFIQGTCPIASLRRQNPLITSAQEILNYKIIKSMFLNNCFYIPRNNKFSILFRFWCRSHLPYKWNFFSNKSQWKNTRSESFCLWFLLYKHLEGHLTCLQEENINGKTCNN